MARKNQTRTPAETVAAPTPETAAADEKEKKERKVGAARVAKPDRHQWSIDGIAYSTPATGDADIDEWSEWFAKGIDIAVRQGLIRDGKPTPANLFGEGGLTLLCNALGRGTQALRGIYRDRHPSSPAPAKTAAKISAAVDAKKEEIIARLVAKGMTREEAIALTA